MVKRVKTENGTTQPARYPVTDLMEQAEVIFGVKPEVIAGALYGINEVELSVDEIKTRVTAFLERKVD